MECPHCRLTFKALFLNHHKRIVSCVTSEITVLIFLSFPVICVFVIMCSFINVKVQLIRYHLFVK